MVAASEMIHHEARTVALVSFMQRSPALAVNPATKGG
jgi:hypothetical protein